MTGETGDRGHVRERALWLTALLALPALPLAVALACTLLRHSFYACDMVATVSTQLALLGALHAVVALACRRWAVGGLAALLALGLVLPAITAPRAPRGTDADARVLVFNAFAESRSFDRSLAMLREVEADLVLLSELNQPFAEAIRVDEQLRARYPHVQLPEDEGKWRHGILSRWPITGIVARDDRWRELRFRYVYRRSVAVERPEGRFATTMVIPTSPRNAERWASGTDELRADCELINAYVTNRGVPVVVGVDLNASVTNARTTVAHEVAGLRRAKPMLATSGTWPASSPALLRVPIDDALLSEGIGVTSWEVIGTPTDSDHAPVLVTIDLPD